MAISGTVLNGGRFDLKTKKTIQKNKILIKPKIVIHFKKILNFTMLVSTNS